MFGILLNSMDYESKLPQKRVSIVMWIMNHLCVSVLQAYIACVVGYINLLGIHCVRHLKVCVCVCVFVCVCLCRCMYISVCCVCVCILVRT